MKTAVFFTDTGIDVAGVIATMITTKYLVTAPLITSPAATS
jgi:hypothetical protein